MDSFMEKEILEGAKEFCESNGVGLTKLDKLIILNTIRETRKQCADRLFQCLLHNGLTNETLISLPEARDKILNS